MVEIFAFAIVLLIAVLISGQAQRGIISTAVLFLVAGYLLGNDVFGVVHINSEDEVFIQIVDVTLFVILFTDGMQLGFRELKDSWTAPGRALFLGLPLTLLLMSVMAFLLLDVTWAKALLLSAALSPTDPVFASAMVSSKAVPRELRRTLNVESGMNDGLALPIVIIMILVVQGDPIDFASLLTELLLGIVIGIVVPWLVVQLEHLPQISTQPVYRPLTGLAIGMLVFSLAHLTGSNTFLAAFTSGMMVSTMAPNFRDAFEGFGETVAELLKLISLFLFGALFSLQFLETIGVGGLAFVVLAIVIVRPIVLALVMIYSTLTIRERLATMWFGPKGFASVVYGLFILGANITEAHEIFHVIAVTVAASIIAHSSTDAFVERWFTTDEPPVVEEAYERVVHDE